MHKTDAPANGSVLSDYRIHIFILKCFTNCPGRASAPAEAGNGGFYAAEGRSGPALKP